MSIDKISEETRQSIIKKSVSPLPNSPSRMGYSAKDIKNAMFGFVTDEESSIVYEINRIVGEMNSKLVAKSYVAEFTESDWEDWGTTGKFKLTIPKSIYNLANAFVENMEVKNTEENCWENNMPTWKRYSDGDIMIVSDTKINCKVYIKGE